MGISYCFTSLNTHEIFMGLHATWVSFHFIFSDQLSKISVGLPLEMQTLKMIRKFPNFDMSNRPHFFVLVFCQAGNASMEIL